jgi:hypothetical protein
MDHTRIEPRTSTVPYGPIRRLSTVGLATVVASAFLLFSIVGSGRAQAPTRSFELLEATIPDLQAALAAGSVTSRDLVTMYLARIDAYDQKGPTLNAISAVNGQALAQADALTRQQLAAQQTQARAAQQSAAAQEAAAQAQFQAAWNQMWQNMYPQQTPGFPR